MQGIVQLVEHPFEKDISSIFCYHRFEPCCLSSLLPVIIVKNRSFLKEKVQLFISAKISKVWQPMADLYRLLQSTCI